MGPGYPLTPGYQANFRPKTGTSYHTWHPGVATGGDQGDNPSCVAGPSNPLLNGVETFETIVSSKDGNLGVARNLNCAAIQAAVRSGEKNISSAFLLIQDKCDTISLPQTVTEIVRQLYQRADEEEMLKGRQVDAIIFAACIFIACQQLKVGQSLEEIVALA
ncbi:hypothetical protein H4Q26_005372 [Puccinia striiformis f. sp. tritici PST-130]|uniref:Transcription factor TFIIB cyclin-like domain-containing protein n=2 Tax=Puccinia striiformis TaxID=27350 RepID=A0A0L0UQI1_9BASI|nr:hypothetical protein H4Q26_005372 [Puccinia striiformis f. sp. tritici PST-130]KNE89293.1 hypothetical protein PSTG_17248 [Puccinia striiformis f. sp. tritici PST-78]POW08917.1 hypothetical protein PSTT_07167 [Puccinia striiformis]